MVQKFSRTNVRQHSKFGSSAVHGVRVERFCFSQQFANLIGRRNQSKNSFRKFDKNKGLIQKF